MKLRYLHCVLLWLFSIAAFTQPIYRFSVKVGIDSESVDSLGGIDKVKQNVECMFNRVNRAFNDNNQFHALYNFEVDWNSFYVYDGISTNEVYKPHPEHDYLVVIDGYKSNPKEVGGGWYGANIQTIYHARIHNDRFNNPFTEQAIDGIIHEFGHSRGMPDIYAMKVDADKNPIAPIPYYGTRCIMNYPYGETFWSKYAINMINYAEEKYVKALKSPNSASNKGGDVYDAPKNSTSESRWEISKDGTIEWNIVNNQLPHNDHIEMSGEQMACVLRWGVDENCALTTERSLVFPMLRRLPYNTHASLMHRIALDVPSLISIDGLALRNPKTESVYIDGLFQSKETFCVGKQNIGSGKGTSPVPAITLSRTIFPSMNKPYLCERYEITSIRERDLILYIPEFSQVFKTLDSSFASKKV